MLRCGVLGSMLSLVAYLYRTSRPAIRSLVPDRNDPARRFTPLDALDDTQPECPQLKLVRIEGAVYFGAVQHVTDRLHAMRSTNPAQKYLLAMTRSMNFIDLAGAELWEHELAERRAAGGDLYFHRPRPEVCKAWHRTGFTARLGTHQHLPQQGRSPARGAAPARPAGLRGLYCAHFQGVPASYYKLMMKALQSPATGQPRRQYQMWAGAISSWVLRGRS